MSILNDEHDGQDDEQRRRILRSNVIDLQTRLNDVCEEIVVREGEMLELLRDLRLNRQAIQRIETRARPETFERFEGDASPNQTPDHTLAASLLDADAPIDIDDRGRV